MDAQAGFSLTWSQTHLFVSGNATLLNTMYALANQTLCCTAFSDYLLVYLTNFKLLAESDL